MVSIRKVAESRIRYNKSRTLLTVISIMLMTVLLMGLGTSVMGLMDMNCQQASAENNIHATFNDLDGEQLSVLKNHKEVEALEANELFATVEYGKMNGYLTCSKSLKDGIYHGVGTLIEGHSPQNVDEISASKAFFERIGVKPNIGNRFTLSFRPGGEGLIQPREFVICGILSEVDISQLNINDTRLVYGASVSEALVKEYFSDEQREYSANLRVFGEEKMNYDEIVDSINLVASDIGCEEKNISYNNQYLYAMTDPGSEMTGIVLGISFLIIFFSGLVIYSIYYISVITDVREIGKLKALGASKKQVRRMLLLEGLNVSLIAVPPGLLIGYLIPRIFLPMIIHRASQTTVTIVPIEELHMFSFAVIILVVAVVFLTVYVSLLKPMRLAAKISPVEAIRYQESGGRSKNRRNPKKRMVTLFRLTAANLTRNKKRTIVTMVTMGLSCVLFLSFAAVLNSASPEDIARRNIPEGDFHLALDCNWNDKDYPQSNLDRVQQENYFNASFLKTLNDLPGVEKVSTKESVLIGSDFPSELFEDGNRTDLSYFSREKAKEYQEEIKQGELDYDTMISENGAIFTSDMFLDEYGLKIGDVLSLSVYDGEQKIPLTITVTGSIDSGVDSCFLIPEEVFKKLDLKTNVISDLYITVSKDQYDSVKEQLTEIADGNEYFVLYAMDEELKIGQMSVNIIKYPMYLILGMVAVISFMNLMNTMITSIVTRKREIGMLQAVGLSNRQLKMMLAGEGMVFTIGSLLAAVTVGNLFGYLLFLWAKASHMLSISRYHYPLWETVGLIAVFVFGQLIVTYFINKRVHRESLIERIRSAE